VGLIDLGLDLSAENGTHQTSGFSRARCAADIFAVNLLAPGGA
jgi:hypothetical protein